MADEARTRNGRTGRRSARILQLRYASSHQAGTAHDALADFMVAHGIGTMARPAVSEAAPTGLKFRRSATSSTS